MQCNAAGQVLPKLETPWRDGTTHLVISPLEFIQRLLSCGAFVSTPVRRYRALDRQLLGGESRSLKYRFGSTAEFDRPLYAARPDVSSWQQPARSR